MIPRYRLEAVYLDGEVCPAIVQELGEVTGKRVIFEPQGPYHNELLQLIAQRKAAGGLGFGLAYLSAIPHYLSDEQAERALKALASVPKGSKMPPAGKAA